MKPIRLSLALLALCAAAGGWAAPKFGFVQVIGGGRPGETETHDDLGPPPIVVNEGLKNVDVGLMRGGYDEYPDVPTAIRIGGRHAGVPTEEEVLEWNANGIYYFIIGNEYDCYGGDWADAYMDFLIPTYNVIKSVNPANVVIGGNLAGPIFDPLYDRGFKNYCDMVGIHSYSNDPSTGISLGGIKATRSQMVAHGDGDKLIFVGEGWGPGRELPGHPRLSPQLDITATEVEMHRDFVVNGYRNITTPLPDYDPNWVFGVLYFTYNDNWGCRHWRDRAIPVYDDEGRILYYIVDGYNVGLNIDAKYWNGGLTDVWGNAKDVLLDIFPGDNLALVNSGFEYWNPSASEHLASMWEARTDPPLALAYAVDSSIRRAGWRSQRVTLGATEHEYIRQTSVPGSITPGTSYTATAWVRTRRLVPGAYTGVRIGLAFENESGQVGTTSWSATLAGTNEWTKVSVSATAPGGADRATIYCDVHGISGTAWFDDTSIVPTSQYGPGQITGFVVDRDHYGIEGATVTIEGTDYTATTDADGYYVIPNVEPGVYNAIATKPGHDTHMVKAQVVLPGRSRAISFELDVPRPDEPTGERVWDPGCGGTLLVSWTNPTGPFDFIRIYRSTEILELGELEHVVDDGSTQLWDTGLEDGTKYYYTVRSVSGGVESDNEDNYVGQASAGPSTTIYFVRTSPTWEPSMWGDDYGQTFVSTIDGYLASASVTPAWGGAAPDYIYMRVREGGPYGPYVDQGPKQVFPGTDDAHFHWNLGEVELHKGVTYYLEVTGGPFAPYRCSYDIYPDGCMYYYKQPVPDREMWSTITAVTPRGVEILDLASSNPVDGKALVTWRTLAPATSIVDWGTGSAFTHSTPEDTEYVTEHAVEIEVGDETGDYIVRARSNNGNNPTGISLVQGLGDAYPALGYLPVQPGWSTRALPVDPEGALEEALSGYPWVLDGTLYTYTPLTGYKSYPGDFTEVSPGEGFWLKAQEPAGSSWRGERLTGGTGIPLSQGWNLLGNPFDRPVAWANVVVTDGYETRPFADSGGWLQPVVFCYAAGSGGYIPCGPGTAEPYLRAGKGYWLKAYESGLTLQVPAPAEPADPPPVVIIDPAVVETGDDWATVAWTTDVAATSRVDYGETDAYGLAVEDEALSTYHEVTLTGLWPGCQYHFCVSSGAPDRSRGYSADSTFWTHSEFSGIENGGFETGDFTGWTKWGYAECVTTGPWYADVVPYEGTYLQGNACNWSAEDGGIYQSFSAVPGVNYTATARCAIWWAGEGTNPEQCTRARIGLDPSGGTDPAAPGVVWSDWLTEPTPTTPPVWRLLEVSATATSSTMTVFLQFDESLMGNPPGGQWHVECFDDVQVFETP